LIKIILGKNIKKTEKNHAGKNTVAINNKFLRKVTVLSSHIVTVIFNQLNIKK
jgi:hypothetical protein